MKEKNMVEPVPEKESHEEVEVVQAGLATAAVGRLVRVFLIIIAIAAALLLMTAFWTFVERTSQ